MKPSIRYAGTKKRCPFIKRTGEQCGNWYWHMDAHERDPGGCTLHRPVEVK